MVTIYKHTVVVEIKCHFPNCIIRFSIFMVLVQTEIHMVGDSSATALNTFKNALTLQINFHHRMVKYSDEGEIIDKISLYKCVITRLTQES